MNPTKQKAKDRRRARKLAEQAWESANAGNLDLAEKIMRRAVSAQEDNPVLWHDLGVLLTQRQKPDEAAESVHAALSLAPTFGDAYAKLANLRLREGRVREAVALQTQAVNHAPDNSEYIERLQAFRVLAGQEAQRSAARQQVESPAAALSPIEDPSIDWSARLKCLDWHALAERVTRDGYIVLAELVDPQTCESLRGMFDDDARFAKTVVMDRPEFGLGTYRYFAAPIPPVVDDLRRAVYRCVAPIANDWRRILGEPADFPSDWTDFRDVCADAGQTTPTPILLKYEAGGFNSLHRDLRGSVFFPLQLAVVLSRGADRNGDGFEGGNFLFCDVEGGNRSRRHEIPLGLGDAILFCTRDRLARVGGAFGLQPVKHGVAPIASGTRFVLGAPFHEYR